MYINPLAEKKTPERNGFTVFLLVFSMSAMIKAACVFLQQLCMCSACAMTFVLVSVLYKHVCDCIDDPFCHTCIRRYIGVRSGMTEPEREGGLLGFQRVRLLASQLGPTSVYG